MKLCVHVYKSLIKMLLPSKDFWDALFNIHKTSFDYLIMFIFYLITIVTSVNIRHRICLGNIIIPAFLFSVSSSLLLL